MKAETALKLVALAKFFDMNDLTPDLFAEIGDYEISVEGDTILFFGANASVPMKFKIVEIEG